MVAQEQAVGADGVVPDAKAPHLLASLQLSDTKNCNQLLLVVGFEFSKLIISTSSYLRKYTHRFWNKCNSSGNISNIPE